MDQHLKRDMSTCDMKSHDIIQVGLGLVYPLGSHVPGPGYPILKTEISNYFRQGAFVEGHQLLLSKLHLRAVLTLIPHTY